jgi:hypothetical protein
MIISSFLYFGWGDIAHSFISSHRYFFLLSTTKPFEYSFTFLSLLKIIPRNIKTTGIGRIRINWFYSCEGALKNK